jgi:hypothetical protein
VAVPEASTRLLERDGELADDVCTKLGQDETAAFQRVSKRVTTLSRSVARRRVAPGTEPPPTGVPTGARDSARSDPRHGRRAPAAR